jgi:hypothetical protein
VQLTGLPPIKASRSFAAFAPHRYWRLSSPRQSCVLSGASIPQSRIRVPCTSSVSPSKTLARPNKSSDKAVPHEAASVSPTSGPLIGSRWRRAIDALQAQCCTALIAMRKRFCGVALKNIIDSVVSLHGAEISELTQNKLTLTAWTWLLDLWPCYRLRHSRARGVVPETKLMDIDSDGAHFAMEYRALLAGICHWRHQIALRRRLPD